MFLPAGTVHAVGGGVLMAEVQQTSDATFRLFDWNRRDAKGQMRQLHIEESLGLHQLGQRPRPSDSRRRISRRQSKPSDPDRQRQRSFAAAISPWIIFGNREPFTCGGTGCLQVLLVLHGRGRLWTGEGVWKFQARRHVLLPAALDTLTCHPEGDLGILLSTLPADSYSV